MCVRACVRACVCVLMILNRNIAPGQGQATSGNRVLMLVLSWSVCSECHKIPFEKCLFILVCKHVFPLQIMTI